MCKCSECGCLAVRPANFSSSLIEASREFREDGFTHTTEKIPHCVMRKIDFRKPEFADDIKEAISAERECNAFVLWVPGFSPKEHYEMFLNDELEAKMEVRRGEDKTFQDKMYSVAWWSSLGTVASVLIALLALVVAIATYIGDK